MGTRVNILRKLRHLMKQSMYVPEPIQAYVIPHDDAHMVSGF